MITPPRPLKMVVDISGRTIWVEDLETDTLAHWKGLPFCARVAAFQDADHCRVYISWADFTLWLLESRSIVSVAVLLGDTLTDEERRP